MTAKGFGVVLGVTMAVSAVAADWPQFCGPDRNNHSVETGLARSWPDSGLLHLIEATPKQFNELASAKVVAEKGQTWAPIALSDGQVIVRDHAEMKCLNLKP